jgi:ABC-type antimicrobial peptide transport system permease subunit
MSVLVIYQQMNFIQSKNLGYKKDNIITFAAEGKLTEDPGTFLNETKNILGVVNASYMRGDLAGLHGGTTALEWEGKDPDKVVDFELIGAGYDLIETLGIELAEGRAFSRDFGTDSATIIFNEVAIERMGLSDPVGKTITLWGEEKRIIGVVKNFHFESLYENVNPLFFQLSPTASGLLVKVKEGSEQETIAQLEKYYQEHNVGIPFEYQFLDETYQKMYAAEQRVSTLSKYFAGIAILISCLGLFGLAAFTAERRLKEIGIRKSLGASSVSIVRLLSSDFTKMVLVAIVIALPLSYLAAQRWLQDFAFHVELRWWYFAGAGLLALLIAWFTVGLQTVRAARVNPVECLRDE